MSATPASNSKIWKEVEAAIASGSSPTIEVAAAAEVPPPKRRRGRPRKFYKTEERIRSNKKVNVPLKTSAGYPMTCRNEGCKKQIPRARMDICCSDRCHAELRDYCKVHLDILDGRVSPLDLPMHYRSLTHFHRKKEYWDKLEKARREKNRKEMQNVIP